MINSTFLKICKKVDEFKKTFFKRRKNNLFESIAFRLFSQQHACVFLLIIKNIRIYSHRSSKNTDSRDVFRHFLWCRCFNVVNVVCPPTYDLVFLDKIKVAWLRMTVDKLCSVFGQIAKFQPRVYQFSHMATTTFFLEIDFFLFLIIFFIWPFLKDVGFWI